MTESFSILQCIEKSDAASVEISEKFRQPRCLLSFNVDRYAGDGAQGFCCTLMSSEIDKPIKVAVIGLGCTGLPLAVALAKQYETVGFDVDIELIDRLNATYLPSPVASHGSRSVVTSQLSFSADPTVIASCEYYFICVPTPVDPNGLPDLSHILSATRTVGHQLQCGAMIVYESTVSPGTTARICAPLLERISGLRVNIDFDVGYSPERINPGDPVHSLANTCRLVSAGTPQASQRLAFLLRTIIEAEVMTVSDTMIAEAAKMWENVQRDVNIALANEMSGILHAAGIDPAAVLEAASTKWNFMPFEPGLVGGHCIAVDPYYMIDFARGLGANSHLIEVARKINENACIVLGQRFIAKLRSYGIDPKSSRILIAGATYKPNSSDLRNSKVWDLFCYLRAEVGEVCVFDPMTNLEDLAGVYGIAALSDFREFRYDGVIIAVKHDLFRMSEYNFGSFSKNKVCTFDVTRD